MAEDDAEPEPEPRVLLLFWIPQEGDGRKGNTRDRFTGVERVELQSGPDEFDQGTLVAHFDNGVGEFDRNQLRGWRTEGDVDVPHLGRAEPEPEQEG